MARFRLRKRVAQALEPDPAFPVPARFNFTRDVVEAAAIDDALRHALTFVDREGVIDRRTFKEVASDAGRWAAYLRSRGLVAGDRVLVFVGRTPAWHAVMLGALKAGIVTVPCSEMLRASDIDFRISHSGATLVVTDRERAPVLDGVPSPVDTAVVEEVNAELKTLSIVEPTHDTGAEDTAFILYTSGTTKEPKGVVHSHGYTWTKRLQAEHWLTARPDDLVWCTAGTGWAKSIWNVLLGPWSCGAEIALHEGGFDAEERFELIERLGVTVLCQAPTEYRMMAKQPDLERFHLGSVRHAVSAGEPLNPEVIEAFRVAFGLTIYDGYGQTENTLLVANVPGVEVKPGSMGRPTPGHEIAVVGDDGTEQPVGVEGEIALRGRPPSLFLRYWDAPDETAAVFWGEWYLTGDRGMRDEDGYLWFTARADDVILSSAYRIGPFEVESALLGHPAVLESAVVGKPDADRGSIVKAFVVLREGYEPSDQLAIELQNHVKTVTAPYKYPREIAFVPDLPKTSSGKIRRVALRNIELGVASAPAAAAAYQPGPPAADAEQAEPVATPAAAAGPAEAAPRPEASRTPAGETGSRRDIRARAKEEERRRKDERKDEEKRRREEEKAAAENARRDAAAAKSTAKAQAKEAARQRKIVEEQRREEERLEAESARRDEDAARAAVKQREADEDRRREEIMARAQRAAAPAAGAAEDASDGPEEHIGPELIARLRAYGRGDGGGDARGDEE